LRHRSVECKICKKAFQINPDKQGFRGDFYCFECYRRSQVFLKKKYEKYPYALSRETLSKALISSGVKPLRSYYELLSRKGQVSRDGEQKEYY